MAKVSAGLLLAPTKVFSFRPVNVTVIVVYLQRSIITFGFVTALIVLACGGAPYTYSGQPASAQAKPLTAALICPWFTQVEAVRYLGAKATLSQVIAYPQESSTDDVRSLSCVYTNSAAKPGSDGTLVVGVRTAGSSSANERLGEAFNHNVVGGEISYVVGGHQAYYLPHDGAIELRVWAKERWVEVHASSLTDASTLATTAIAALH